MAEVPAPTRVFLEDARRNGRYLRATWHPGTSQFVVSSWHDDVCAATVRLSPEDAATLVSHLAGALASGVARALPGPPTGRQRVGLWDRLHALLRRDRTPPLPDVAELRRRPSA